MRDKANNIDHIVWDTLYIFLAPLAPPLLGGISLIRAGFMVHPVYLIINALATLRRPLSCPTIFLRSLKSWCALTNRRNRQDRRLRGKYFMFIFG